MLEPGDVVVLDNDRSSPEEEICASRIAGVVGYS
jgi:hypothetical protein